MDIGKIKEKFLSLEEKTPFPRSVILVLSIAVFLRLLFWTILPPVWKMHAAVYSLDKSFIEYCGNFIGYKAGRPPFIDWFMGRTYLLTKSFLGSKGLTLLPTALGIISLPFGYSFAKKTFNKKIALYSLIFLSFYPKFIYIAARGLPEASSLSLVIISLYCLQEGMDGKKYFLLLSGILAAFAYLFYIPVLLFIGTTFLFILLRNRRKIITGFKEAVLYSFPSLVALYFHFTRGPLKQVLLSGPGGIRESIFINPEAYSVFEKAGRYILYSFFDFWWHFRGFDYEHAIMKRIDIFSEAIPYFNVAALVWFFAAILLTIPIIYSFKLILDRKNDKWLIYIFMTPFLYWGWWCYKAIFKHGLQTRHIFPQIAFMAVLFGIGLVAIKDKYRKLKKYFPTLCYISLSLLLLTALGHAVMFSRSYRETFTDPVEYIEENNIEGKFGVMHQWSYKFFKSTSPEMEIKVIHERSVEEDELNPRLYDYVVVEEPSITSFKHAGFDYIIDTKFFGTGIEFREDIFNGTGKNTTLIYENMFRGRVGTRIYRID